MPLNKQVKTRRVRFPWRAIRRVVTAELLFVLCVVGVSGVVARHYLEDRFLAQVESQAHDNVLALSHDLPAVMGRRWCVSHAARTGFRLTAISTEGQVICDSGEDPRGVENQAGRPEVREAFESGAGHSLRFSPTLDQEMIYSAIQVPAHQLVLREAIPLSVLSGTMSRFSAALTLLLLTLSVTFALTLLWMGRSLIAPMQHLVRKASGEEDDDSSSLVDASRESGEWSDLESALDRIQSDLIHKTEQLSREREELSTLMSAISDAIFAVDLDGNPLFFNSRFVLLFGGKDFQTHRPRLGEIFRTPEILGAYHGAFQEGRTQNANVGLRIAGDVSQRFFSVAVAPLLRSDGTVYGAVGIFHDVTELKRAEKIRIDFVANVSHELRTPLTSIKGYADTLREDVSNQRFDAAEKFLEIIQKNVDRLMNLIRDLLELSWLDSAEGGEGMAKSSVGTRELTERVLVQLENRRSEKKHQIEATYETESVSVDPARAEQVVVNLVENAIKYTPPGGRITVLWTESPADIVLKVSDTGPGIAPEHHSRLFERFYRVDQARSREMGGTGLGLAIVKHIMQRHGGSISVSSNPGAGTTFICRFPKS